MVEPVKVHLTTSQQTTQNQKIHDRLDALEKAVETINNTLLEMKREKEIIKNTKDAEKKPAATKQSKHAREKPKDSDEKKTQSPHLYQQPIYQPHLYAPPNGANPIANAPFVGFAPIYIGYHPAHITAQEMKTQNSSSSSPHAAMDTVSITEASGAEVGEAMNAVNSDDNSTVTNKENHNIKRGLKLSVPPWDRKCLQQARLSPSPHDYNPSMPSSLTSFNLRYTPDPYKPGYGAY